jgi:hypothetical protein
MNSIGNVSSIQPAIPISTTTENKKASLQAIQPAPAPIVYPALPVEVLREAMRLSRGICPCSGKQEPCEIILQTYLDAQSYEDQDMLDYGLKEVLRFIEASPDREQGLALLRGQEGWPQDPLPLTPLAPTTETLLQKSLSEETSQSTIVATTDPSHEAPPKAVTDPLSKEIRTIVSEAVLTKQESQIATKKQTNIMLFLEEITHTETPLRVDQKNSPTAFPVHISEKKGPSQLESPKVKSSSETIQTASPDTTPSLRPTELPKKQALAMATENTPTHASPQTQATPSHIHSARQETMTWLQNALQNHTEKTLNTGQKVLSLISEKTPEALVVVRQSIEQLRQMPPKIAESKMSTLANIIAHVGKADSEQLQPTLSMVNSLLHLPAETLTTVGHSLALVAKQQPEHLPVIRALLESVPQTAKTLTAVAQIILEGIPHAQQEGPTPRSLILPSLAAIVVSVGKTTPENLSHMSTTLINVAQTHPETLPTLAQALNLLTDKSPETHQTLPQLIQTIATTQPSILPEFATTLRALGNTATPQQVIQSIQQITTTALETPHTAPLLLEVLHTAINIPSAQHTVSPVLQQTEIRNAVFRATPTPHTASDIQTKGIAFSQQPTQTAIPQLRAQKTLDATLQLLANAAKTDPETVPLLLLTVHKAEGTQKATVLQTLRTLSETHPRETKQVAAALLHLGQTLPKHVDKALTLLSPILQHSPALVAPLARALETLSLFPQTIQRDALNHLQKVIQTSPQTFESTCISIANVTENQKQSAPISRQTEAPRNSQTSEPTAARGQGPEKEAPIPATQKKSDTPMTTSNKPGPTSQPVPETAPHGKPTTANHMAQRLALFGQISAHSPRDLAATRMTVATITTKAPAALGQTFVAISAVGTHTPQHLAAALTLLSAIADKAPAALAQVATTLSGIATHAPQHLAAVVTLLSAIADKAPAALTQVATTLASIATHAPQHLAAVVTLLSAIADKAPAALAQVATTLSVIAQKSPELFKMILEIGQKMATKAPDLLPKLSQFLIQLHEHSPIDKLHNQLLALMHALAAEASEENTLLLQKLLTLGELKAAEDPALHAYVSAEIKKTRDKAKKAREGKLAKQSSTDQLIQMFDHMEMENWKLAAMFRKSLQLSQTS